MFYVLLFIALIIWGYYKAKAARITVRVVDSKGWTVSQVLRKILKIPPTKTIRVMLSTNNASLDDCERIAKTLHGRKYTAFIVGDCSSTGTLLALGANKIVMQPGFFLGKMDFGFKQCPQCPQCTQCTQRKQCVYQSFLPIPLERIHGILRELGIEDPEGITNCFTFGNMCFWNFQNLEQLGFPVFDK